MPLLSCRFAPLYFLLTAMPLLGCGALPDEELPTLDLDENMSALGSGKPRPCKTRTTCTEQGKNCGIISDGCGGSLDCGTCSASQTCGGGGVANVCGCTPTTCTEQGKNCGIISDGCGGALDCGTCSASQTCGGGGVANVCAGLCADASDDQVYGVDMAGCNGPASSGQTSALCAADAHVCTVAEFVARGGAGPTNINNARRYLSSTYSSQSWCNQGGSAYPTILVPGSTGGICTLLPTDYGSDPVYGIAPQKYYYTSSCDDLTYGGWFGNCGGTFGGVVCCR